MTILEPPTESLVRVRDRQIAALRAECELIADSRDRAEAMFRQMEEAHELLDRQRQLFCELLDRAEQSLATIADTAPNEVEQQRLHHKLAGVRYAQKLATSHLRSEQ